MLDKKHEQIIKAWIAVEQLAEGNIKKDDPNHRSLKVCDFEDTFLKFIQQQKEKEKLSEQEFLKAGIVVYFGVFPFRKIINFLRMKHNIKKTYEDIDETYKFTFALCFDKSLNLIPNKLFFTMSGYIRNEKELPHEIVDDEDGFACSFSKYEAEFKCKVVDKFRYEDFNVTFKDLLKTFNISCEECHYTFVKKLDNDKDTKLLHSFYINDLRKVRAINSENLNRYLAGFNGIRQNLDGNINSSHFNPQIFANILQPKYYPLGRFPVNPSYDLSFMQQVAVNLALCGKNELQSVNGPPGTGKTTLLREIIADLVVQQAIAICNLKAKHLKGDLTYKDEDKIATLPPEIADKGVVVASSNNGAVQNIVNELPLNKTTIYLNEIDGVETEITAFSESLLEVNYFTEIINECHGNDHSEFWGAFSKEGGTYKNVHNLLDMIQKICNELETVKEKPNGSIYKEFQVMYQKLDTKRNEMQKDAAKITNLLASKNSYQQEKRDFNLKENKYIKKKLDVKQKYTENEWSLQSEKRNAQIAQNTFETVQQQKPSFLALRKLFTPKKVQGYFEKLNKTIAQQRGHNEKINKLETNGKKLRTEYEKLQKYDKLLGQKKAKLNAWKQEIEMLEKMKRSNEIKSLDFTLSYEQLQKANFWFDDDFRREQSELFIKALAVRKQFLYENRKHIKRAVTIWRDQFAFLSRGDGEQIIKTAWNWINLTIPVISTTFASFGRMFHNLGVNALGNLFIDEAGQASPQASVGAIFRSKRITVVGDPYQIKPVVTVDNRLLKLLADTYKVKNKFLADGVSTQLLADEASQFGFQKNEDEWIGIPLWVHRRSSYPMFTIANAIAYDNLMVQCKNKDQSKGKSAWLNIEGGIASNKFVKEQADFLKEEILKLMQTKPELEGEIFVVTPFKNVATELKKNLKEVTKKNHKFITIGTVHTFQGKEAKIVYFVLGADNNSKGAAKWAVFEPNIMNVAATRAKEEFYIIGSKMLYRSLGSGVVNETIKIIDAYNKVQ